MFCFDIGANVGKWAVANKDNYNEIISIEASPDTFKILLDNTSSIQNITCLCYAVCNNENKEVVFYSSPVHQLSSLNQEWFSAKSRFDKTPYHAIKCASITLDKLIEHYGTPDLIKIDVESGEYLTISSLTKKVPMICFEWASEMHEITLKCLEHLSQLGFDKYYIQYEDDYTFQPQQSDYKSLESIKQELLQTVSKVDWGMIWTQ